MRHKLLAINVLNKMIFLGFRRTLAAHTNGLILHGTTILSGLFRHKLQEISTHDPGPK